MTKRIEKLAVRDAARANLRRRLRVGSIVYVTQHNVSRDGMTRRLSLSIVRNGEHVDITRAAAAALGEHVYTFASDGYAPTIRVGGCGMDMHFYLVYSLGRAIRPNGHACTGEERGPRRCPSNDHTNDYGRLSREYAALLLEHRSAEDYCARRAEWMDAQPTYDRKRQHADSGYTLNYRTLS